MFYEFDWRGFEENHSDDRGKFKEGEIVKYIGPKSKLDPNDWRRQYIGKTFEVRASNVVDDEETEYLLAGFPYLVWEEEIEEIIND